MTASALAVAPSHRHSHHWLTGGMETAGKCAKRLPQPNQTRQNVTGTRNLSHMMQRQQFFTTGIVSDQQCIEDASESHCTYCCSPYWHFLASPFLFFIALLSPLTPHASFALFGTRQGVSSMAKVFQDHGQQPHLWGVLPTASPTSMTD